MTLKNKAKADAKAQHTFKYVSILRRLLTQLLRVKCIFELACDLSLTPSHQYSKYR
jgi:hypothetical protein